MFPYSCSTQDLCDSPFCVALYYSCFCGMRHMRDLLRFDPQSVCGVFSHYFVVLTISVASSHAWYTDVWPTLSMWGVSPLCHLLGQSLSRYYFSRTKVSIPCMIYWGLLHTQYVGFHLIFFCVGFHLIFFGVGFHLIFFGVGFHLIFFGDGFYLIFFGAVSLVTNCIACNARTFRTHGTTHTHTHA